MRINVLIPTYRRPHHLQEALGSIRAQSHADWRAIVVDDGDGEGIAVANQFGDPRITAFRNPGRGQVDARNAALDHADGDIVMLLDDDDLLLDSEHMALVADRLRQGPALVHRSGWFLFEREGQDLGRELFAPGATAESLRQDNTLLTCGLAWPSSLHHELGPFDPEMGSYFDWDWTLRVLGVGVPLHEVPGAGVGYRIHATNTSGSRSEKRTAAFERFCIKHGLELVQKDHLTVLRERQDEPRDPPH